MNFQKYAQTLLDSFVTELNVKKDKWQIKVDAIRYPWHVLEFMEELMDKELINKKSGTVEENVIIKGIAYIAPSAVIKGMTYIEGPVFIGKNVKIGPHAYLRKYSIILDNCHIGSSEVKNSLFLPKSNMGHFGYAGDSLVGSNVNFGAGTKLANLRFDGKNIKMKIGDTVLDSTRRKMGAVIGDGVRAGCNAVIGCGAIVEKKIIL